MTTSLIGYATYLPRYRLGNRVVASFDEDSTTMAVAAAAAALPGHAGPHHLYFATSSPAYADKTNAAAIHSALGLSPDVFATDLCGTGRSAIAAVRMAAATGGLTVSADVRVGRPGSADEKRGGDGAAALLFGDGPAIAEIIATTSLTAEFLDRWRTPTSLTGDQWEERFGFERYTALIRCTVEGVLDDTGLPGADHVVLACPNTAIIKRASSLVKGLKSVVTSPIGFAGASDAVIALCGVLDTAGPGETVLVVSAVDGCDAVLLRTADSLRNARQPHPVNEQRANGLAVSHLTYLTWRGLLEREPPRRPEPDRPAAPPAARAESVEVRVRRIALRQLRVQSTCHRGASAAGAATVDRMERARARRQARHRRHVHRRPARVLALAADDRRGRRLRRRRALHARGRRRRARATSRSARGSS